MPCGSIVYNIDSFATSSGRSNPEKLICQLDDGLEGNEVIIKQKKNFKGGMLRQCEIFVNGRSKNPLSSNHPRTSKQLIHSLIKFVR